MTFSTGPLPGKGLFAIYAYRPHLLYQGCASLALHVDVKKEGTAFHNQGVTDNSAHLVPCSLLSRQPAFCFKAAQSKFCFPSASVSPLFSSRSLPPESNRGTFSSPLYHPLSWSVSSSPHFHLQCRQTRPLQADGPCSLHVMPVTSGE